MNRKQILFLLCASSLFGLPQGPEVQYGELTVSSSGRSMTLFQESEKAIVNWESFHLEAFERVSITQGSKEWAILNRVVKDSLPSRIDGQLTADGRVFLINPAGVVVGPFGQVRTAEFVASAFQISDEAFLAGKLDFFPEQWEGCIVNAGSIAALEGDVQLIGPIVSNEGMIVAPNGTVRLSLWPEVMVVDSKTAVKPSSKGRQLRRDSVEAMQADLDLQGGSALGFAINCEGIREVCSSGKIWAKEIELSGDHVIVEPESVLVAIQPNGGGKICIDSTLSTIIEKGAWLQASAFEEGDGGEIFIWSDCNTQCLGHLEACGGEARGNGGLIEISSVRRLRFDGDADTSAPLGSTGRLLIDPSSISIDDFGGTSSPSFPTMPPGTYDPSSASCQLDVSNIQTALASNNVTVLTSGGSGGAGDITISKGFTWNAQTTFSAIADRSIIIENDVSISSTFTGAGSSWTAVDLQANQGTPVSGQFAGASLGRRSSITSAEGNIQILGKGGDTGDLNYGIHLWPESSIQSTGIGSNAATIILTGSGNGFDGNAGIYLDRALISSSLGEIALTGSSIGTGSYNHGIFSLASAIQSTGASGGAPIAMQGTSSGGLSANSGIAFDDGSILYSITGAISLTGTSTGAGNYCRGIDFNGSTAIESIGSGMNAATLTLNGTGGGGMNENHGVSFRNDSSLQSIDGTVQITGISHGSADYNHGIQVMDNSTILSTGNDSSAANITLTGMGGIGNENTQGVYIDTNAQVSAIAGTVTINSTP